MLQEEGLQIKKTHLSKNINLDKPNLTGKSKKELSTIERDKITQTIFLLILQKKIIMKENKLNKY